MSFFSSFPLSCVALDIHYLIHVASAVAVNLSFGFNGSNSSFVVGYFRGSRVAFGPFDGEVFQCLHNSRGCEEKWKERLLLGLLRGRLPSLLNKSSLSPPPAGLKFSQNKTIPLYFFNGVCKLTCFQENCVLLCFLYASSALDLHEFMTVQFGFF